MLIKKLDRNLVFLEKNITVSLLKKQNCQVKKMEILSNTT